VIPGRPRRRRLFFALWPEGDERRALAAAVAPALAVAGGRAVPAENLHLTLEFLGAVADEQLPVLATLGAAVRLPDEAIVLDGLRYWDRAQTLAVVAGATPAGWRSAQQSLREALAGSGFRIDARPWLPHVTLVRKLRHPPPLAPARPFEWRPAELALVASEPSPAGSRYTPLARWRHGTGHVDFSAH
jgi:2'-5' RNA ligase